jgi:signal transduction histidine kinase
MSVKKWKLLRGFNRYRLILTLGVAVLLPAAGLIFVTFSQLKTFERDKVLEAAFHRDFQEMLAITEKRINKKIYTMVEEVRESFPSPDSDEEEKEKKLKKLVAAYPWVSEVLLSDEKSVMMQGEPHKIRSDHANRERVAESYRTWFKIEGESMLERMHKQSRPMTFYTNVTRKPDGDIFATSVLFTVPHVDKKRIVIGGMVFDDVYLKKVFFPELLQEALTDKLADQSGNRITMSVFPFDAESGYYFKPFATSTGWEDGKPEVSRKFDDVFRGLALGIKFQGTSVKKINETLMHRSFWILGILSLLIVGGLVLTKHMVSKEMALARLKSDFVSNVSHELRTPLALIRLYAETLELGRITTHEKKDQYYRIIRKESERLTALINNILDFSRIEAGRKEYEFRQTNIAELVRNTLDSYRYQIEQQGFELEETIDPTIPPLQVDREAIARALVNLINNALKYSDEEKYLGVRLYRDNGVVKLEVIDHGIGIGRHDQSKIFEKFYRAGDPLVHNTKGSGLGLSLVRHISQAHGGDIVVESIPGRGSKFILSLPIPSTKQPMTEQATEGPIAV